MTKEVSMLFTQMKKIAVSVIAIIAVFGLVTPVSFAAETQSAPSADAIRIAAKLTPAQLQTISKKL